VRTSIYILIFALGAIFSPKLGCAQQAPSFQGKVITILAGDGGYATYPRALAEYLPRYLPGRPTMVVKDMPGAGMLVASTYIYEAAPPDGTQISIVTGTTATARLFKMPNIRFEPRRFAWLGSMTSDVGVVVSGANGPVKTMQDVFDRNFIVGGGGATSGNVIFPTLMNRLLGTRFKIIKGYRSSDEAGLAIERGEVEGVASWNYSGLRSAHEHLLRDNKLNLLLQLSLQRHPALLNVPTVAELARNEEQRAILELVFASQSIARAFIAPPATPAEIVAIFRRAFDQMLMDPDFRAYAAKNRLEIINPMTGEEVQALVNRLHAYPKELVDTAIKMTTITD